MKLSQSLSKISLSPSLIAVLLLTSGCGVTSDISDMNKKMDEMNENLRTVRGNTGDMKGGLNQTNTDTDVMSKKLVSMADTFNSIGDLLEHFGIASGEEFDLDKGLGKAAHDFKNTHSAQLIPMFIDMQKQQLVNQGAKMYNSGIPESRYVAIGNLIAFGTVTTLTAYTGIDGNIKKFRPFSDDNMQVNIEENNFIHPNSTSAERRIAPIMSRAYEVPIEWTLAAAGVIKTIHEKREQMTKVPYFSAESLDNAGIVAIFMVNQLADHADQFDSQMKLASKFGRLLRKWWPFDSARVTGVEHQSYLMIEWYMHQMVCEFQSVVNRIEKENASAPEFLKTDEVTLQNLKAMATKWMPLTAERYLTVRGYGPYATKEARKKLIKRDFRRANESADDVQLLWDPNWKTNMSRCVYSINGQGESLEKWVDKSYSGEFPREFEKP